MKSLEWHAMRRSAAFRYSAAALALVAAGLVWWAWPALNVGSGDAAQAAGGAPNWRASPFAAGPPKPQDLRQAAAQAEAEQAVLRVQAALTHGSLQGTALDGSWGILVGDTLQASLALRQRFDYLLTLRGEVSASELRHWLAQQARLDIGSASTPEAVAGEHLRQLLALWDNYSALLAQPNPAAVLADSAALADPQRRTAALAARQALREQWVGPQWTAAFYADEDAALQDFAQRRQLAAGSSPTADVPPGAAQQSSRGNANPALAATPEGALLVPSSAALAPGQQLELLAQRTAAYGAEAAQRLAAEDALRQDWEQRLAAARSQVQALQRAPELSAPQRLAAQESLLTERFGGGELLRARALLLPAQP